MNWDMTMTDLFGFDWKSQEDQPTRQRPAPVWNGKLPNVPASAILSPAIIPNPEATHTSDELATRPIEDISQVMSKPIDDEEFARLVDAHYESLYRFAVSLAHSDADARDLVQDTFARLAQKGSQLRSLAKAKSWLFTTLYRAYIDTHRHHARHPQVDLESAELELPVSQAVAGEHLDATMVQEALSRVDEVFRVPLILFYLEQHSYLEIAEILSIPVGTVMSRISRGRAALRLMFDEKELVSTTEHLGRRGVA